MHAQSHVNMHLVNELNHVLLIIQKPIIQQEKLILLTCPVRNSQNKSSSPRMRVEPSPLITPDHPRT